MCDSTFTPGSPLNMSHICNMVLMSTCLECSGIHWHPSLPHFFGIQATLIVKCYTETFYFKKLNCFLLYCTMNLNLNQGRAMQCDVRHTLL